MGRKTLGLVPAAMLAVLVWPFALQAQSLPAVSGVSFDGQQISWTPVDDATGYNIHIGFDYLTTVGNVTTYTPEISGKYVVVAYNDQGFYSPIQIIDRDVVPTTNSVVVDISGGASNPIDTSLPVDPIPVSTESLGLVTGTAIDGASIVWDTLPGAIGYNVYRDFDYLTTVSATSYTPVLSGRYHIVGYDNAGRFSPLEIIIGADAFTTNIVDFNTSVASSTPSDTVLEAVSNVAYDGQTITWDSLDGATGYNVHFFFRGGSGWTYLSTLGDVTSYVPQMPGPYLIVGYDDAGNFSPFQVIEGGTTVSTNSVTVPE